MNTPDPDIVAQRVLAERAAQDTFARIGDPDDPAKIDDETGSLLDDGWHLLRSGTTVVLSTWQGREVTDHDTVKAAKTAFTKLAEREN